MANFVTGNYRIAGKKERVLNFINEGIKNSGFEPKSDIMEAFNFLVENARSKATGRWDGKEGTIKIIDKMTIATFRPLPDTFYMFDTTNEKLLRNSTNWDEDRTPIFNSDEEYEAYSKGYDEAKKEQEEKYGVVGWYDAGLKYYSTKWAVELKDFEIEVQEDTNEVMISFSASTAWSIPEAWLHWIKETFKVNVFYLCFEESNAFNCYGEIDREEFDAGDFSSMENYPQETDFGSDDDFYDACWEFQDEAKDEMYGDFDNFVREFDLEDFDEE